MGANQTDAAAITDFLKYLGQHPDQVIAFHQDPDGFMTQRGLTSEQQDIVKSPSRLRDLFGLKENLPTCWIFGL